MKSLKWHGVTVFFALAIVLVTTGCDRSDGDQIPELLCGTRIDRELFRSVLTSTGDLTESNRLDPSEGISAPCTLFSSGKRILELHFYYSTASPEFAGRSKYDPVFRDISQWKSVNIADEAIVGNNGAIVSGSCVVGRNTDLIIEMRMPEVNIMDESHRKDIEKFMRAYFPATVKTLHCR
ncbi:hypothetical protein [Streptomyces sp. JHA26]|uniref:hypothetical protein n=1 Tax=Streptomyces sp. JHA26 TaxID=1917143 RepID=UPI00098BBD86|nr:hypothetical protein [Streptomyces sp. JHA26]